MRYQTATTFVHGQSAKLGLLLVNLGTPDAPTAKALRPYLREFLSDPRVVEIPRALWWCILNGIIVPFRSPKSAKKYATVWTEQGSPLLAISQAQTLGIRERLQQQFGDQLVVSLGMRYGNPSIESALTELQQQGVTRLLVLPLYPQYSAATTATAFDQVARVFSQWRWLPELRFINHYHDYPPYIECMAQHVEHYWQQHGRADKLVFSFHGLPERNLRLGDPYFCECHKTVRLLTARLGLATSEYLTTFQSRFGKAKWLTPYTDKSLEALAKEGVQSVQVFCPGFSADCLETLEEIDEENREIFLHAGGQSFAYIPALNDAPAHLDTLVQLVGQHLQGWALTEPSAEQREQALAAVARERQTLGLADN